MMKQTKAMGAGNSRLWLHSERGGTVWGVQSYGRLELLLAEKGKLENNPWEAWFPSTVSAT